MTPYSEAGTPAPSINFAQWDEEKRLPSVATLGYSPTEIQTLLRHRYALTDLMGEHFDHLFRRSSGKLNTKGRALAAFEHYDRRTTYEEIASACSISATSAYRVMLAVRKYVSSASADCFEWSCCRDRKFINMRFDPAEADAHLKGRDQCKLFIDSFSLAQLIKLLNSICGNKAGIRILQGARCSSCWIPESEQLSCWLTIPIFSKYKHPFFFGGAISSANHDQ